MKIFHFVCLAILSTFQSVLKIRHLAVGIYKRSLVSIRVHISRSKIRLLHCLTIRWHVLTPLLLSSNDCRNDETRQPLSRKVPVASSKLNPYRMVIVLRLVVLGIFLHYRITNPVPNAYALWLISVICEIWFAFSWILDQFPKWLPINRETYLDRLALR